MSFSGKLIVFTAPSGSGKTTIVRHILDTFPETAFSVSATTRQRRSHETITTYLLRRSNCGLRMKPSVNGRKSIPVNFMEPCAQRLNDCTS